MVVTATQIDRERVQELTEREEKRLNERTGGSSAMYERARKTLSGGVASSYQVRAPWPIYLERGQGAKVWDVDGNELLDFHNGFGSWCRATRIPRSRMRCRAHRLGTHFAAPTEDGVVVGEELARRWGLPKWRYTNRAPSDDGCDPHRPRPHRPRHNREDLRSYPATTTTCGIDRRAVHHRSATGQYASLPYGRAPQSARPDHRSALQRRRSRSAGSAPDRGGPQAPCVIMEAAMMNLGVVLPEPATSRPCARSRAGTGSSSSSTR